MAKHIFLFCIVSIACINKIASFPLPDHNYEEPVDEAVYGEEQSSELSYDEIGTIMEENNRMDETTTLMVDVLDEHETAYNEEPSSELSIDELATTEPPAVMDEDNTMDETTTAMVDVLNELFQEAETDSRDLSSSSFDAEPTVEEIPEADYAYQPPDETDSQSTQKSIVDEPETTEDLYTGETGEENSSDDLTEQLTTQPPLPEDDEIDSLSDSDGWLDQNIQVTDDAVTTLPDDESLSHGNIEITVQTEETDPTPDSLDVDVVPQEETETEETHLDSSLPLTDGVSLTVSEKVEEVTGTDGEIEITEQLIVENENTPDVSTAELATADDEPQESNTIGTGEEPTNDESFSTNATETLFINEYPSAEDQEQKDGDVVLILATDSMERDTLADEPQSADNDLISTGGNTDTVDTSFWNAISSPDEQLTPEDPWNAPTSSEFSALFDGLPSADDGVTAIPERSLLQELLAETAILTPEEDVSYALNILPNSTPETPQTVHLTTIDMDETDMRLSLVWKLDPIVMDSCNKYNSSSQTGNAIALLAQLKQDFPMYNWNVLVTEKIPQSLQFTYRGRFRAGCNGNEYVIWYSTGKSEDNNKDIRSSSS